MSDIDKIAVWFDVEVGHQQCPVVETKETCRYYKLEALIQEQVRLARIDEIERIIRIAAVDDRNVDIRLKELKK